MIITSKTEEYAPNANHFSISFTLLFVKLEKRNVKERRISGNLISNVILEISLKESPAERDALMEKRQKERMRIELLFHCFLSFFVNHDAMPKSDNRITGIGA